MPTIATTAIVTGANNAPHILLKLMVASSATALTTPNETPTLYNKGVILIIPFAIIGIAVVKAIIICNIFSVVDKSWLFHISEIFNKVLKPLVNCPITPASSINCLAIAAVFEFAIKLSHSAWILFISSEMLCPVLFPIFFNVCSVFFASFSIWVQTFV